MSAGGADYYYAKDATGSVRTITGAAGATEWTYTYEPFGTTKTSTQVDRRAPSNFVGFDDGYHEPDGSTYWFGTREYSPTLGRFLSADQLRGARPGASFLFADNNPLAYNDPNGRDPSPAGGSDSGGDLTAKDAAGNPDHQQLEWDLRAYAAAESAVRVCNTSKSTCPADLIDWYFAAQRAYFTLAMKMTPCYVWTNSSASWCGDRNDQNEENKEEDDHLEHVAGALGSCVSGAIAVSEYTDTYGAPFDETGVPEVVGIVGGCIAGGFFGYHGADLP